MLAEARMEMSEIIIGGYNKMDDKLDGLSDRRLDPEEVFVLEEILDLDLLGLFCEKNNVKFVRAEMTYERGIKEPMYYFSDNLGGYIIDAIRDSV